MLLHVNHYRGLIFKVWRSFVSVRSKRVSFLICGIVNKENEYEKTTACSKVREIMEKLIIRVCFCVALMT